MSNKTKQPGVAALPDGSGFGIMSFPLPKDHWLYADREYEEGAVEPKELPKSILTHAVRDTVVAAVRYAIRGATMCGKEMDFDPDALVQNAVYALCGPYYSKDQLTKQPTLPEAIALAREFAEMAGEEFPITSQRVLAALDSLPKKGE